MDKATNQIKGLKKGALTSRSGVVTLKDIALHAKVSEVAAGRVLLGSGKKSVRVGVNTAERIRKIANELGYKPNRIAQQLAGKRSKVLGVIIDSYAAQVDFIKLSEMERKAAKLGYRFMVGQSHGELDRIAAYADDFVQRGVEGIICVSHQYPKTAHKVSQIFRGMKNVVYISRPEFVDQSSLFVDIDRADGIVQAYDYLSGKGRERIALVTASDSDNLSIQERFTGYKNVIAKYPDHDEIICDLSKFGSFNLSDTLGEAELRIMAREIRRLAVDKKVDAMLVENDSLACIVIKTLRDLNLSVPGDVSIVGYDNLQLGMFYDPPLTTLDQKPKEQAEKAVELLVNVIEGKEVPAEERQIVSKPALIVRGSA